MADENDGSIDIAFEGMTYGVTDMKGRTIGYLKNFLTENGLVIPEGGTAKVFTARSLNDSAEGIVAKMVSIRFLGPGEGFNLRIEQGNDFEVTDEYVLHADDIEVRFK